MGRWWKLRARLRRATATRELIEESEAYLAGCFAERAARLRGGVPAWTLLNTVAHGDLAQIRAAASGAAPASVAYPFGWSRAARQLAVEVATVVGDDETRLAALQMAVLIPFELEFLNEHGSGGDLATALAWARAALHTVGGRGD